MEKKSLAAILLAPVVLLLVPFVAMRFTTEVAWDAADFLIAWTLMAGAGLAFKLATSRARNLAHRAAAGLALATAFVLVWGNLAVGLIGNEDNPANLLYFGVLVVGVAGSCLARFEPRGMARALFATALAQFLVPVVAFLIWRPAPGPGVAKVFLLNTVFALLFVGSAILFRIALGKRGGDADGSTASARSA